MSIQYINLSFTGGGDPTATRLILGEFEFMEFEVPERVVIPGRQKTVQHQLIGGRRIIDVLGTEYEPLTWSGVITGSQAGERVGALERMRDEGRPTVLTFDDYRFTVIITRFAPVYEYVWRRPYSIELAIISNDGYSDKADALTGALRGLIDSDLGRALGLSSMISIDAVTRAVKDFHQAVKQITDFAHATVAQIQSVIRPLIAARNIIQHELALLEAAAGDITSLGGLVPGNPVSKTVSNLLIHLDCSTRILALYRLQEVLGRLNKNVRTGQSAEGVKAVTLAGGNLYQVASEQYGDASMWTRIAEANDLTDPQLSGINTLQIPSGATS
ncbi:hypothetical protein PMI39_022950 [Pantoea sp. YR343]|jgi:hypothetical protein|uniref:hypothetical protein n=1 Tax=Pantoea sp. YR343 TaxID=1144341 RepID=UPI000270F6C8|nr:hypothetical protein [Pantoea sp. YR343]KAJ9430425.1 hypothetical protein PMI39_022950 [Pantoea sp. YR343]